MRSKSDGGALDRYSPQRAIAPAAQLCNTVLWTRLPSQTTMEGDGGTLIGKTETRNRLALSKDRD